MKLHEQLGLQHDIEVPYHVMRATGSKKVMVAGDQAAITGDGDFMTKDALREAIAWYVDQLGGKVTWK